MDIGLLAAVMPRVCLGGGGGSGVVLAALGAVGVSVVVLLVMLGAVGVSAMVMLSVALTGVRVGGLVASAGLAGGDCGLICYCGVGNAGSIACSPPKVRAGFAGIGSSWSSSSSLDEGMGLCAVGG